MIKPMEFNVIYIEKPEEPASTEEKVVELVAQLNAQGVDGWVLVMTIPQWDRGVYAVFQREVP